MKVGRPSKDYEVKYKGFNIRIDLVNKIETYPNQTKIVEEALEMYFNLDEESEQHLLKEEVRLERELKSVRTLRNQRKVKREEEEEERKQLLGEQETKLIDEYQSCREYICNIYDVKYLGNSKKSVADFNNRFGTHINDEQQLKKFAKSVKNGEDVFDMFKGFKKKDENE